MFEKKRIWQAASEWVILFYSILDSQFFFKMGCMDKFLKAAQRLHGFILFQTWKEKRALILNTTTANALNFCMKSSQHSNYGFSQSPPTDRECLLTELLFAILLILQEDHKDNNYEDFCMLFSSITSLPLFRESRSIEKYSPYIINSFQ